MNILWMIFGYTKTYLDKCRRDNIGAYAAQAAFFTIMSSIPICMILVSIFKYLPGVSDYFNELLYSILPENILPTATTLIEVFMEESIGLFTISVLFAIWASGVAFHNITVGLNRVNQIDETRNWFIIRFKSIFYTLIMIVALTILLIMIVFTQRIQSLFNEEVSFITYMFGIRPIIRWVVILLVLVILFATLYTLLPNKKISFVSQLPGAVVCAFVWYGFSFVLMIWVNTFGGFSMYGTLTTIVLTMFWLYFCMYFMLMCAEFNVIFEAAFGEKIQKKYEDFLDKHPSMDMLVGRLKGNTKYKIK